MHKSEVVIGIDVGDENKGFHGAVLAVKRMLVIEIFHETEPTKIVRFIKKAMRCHLLAIDGPPKALIKGKETRSAERELARRGYRPQWTRRKPPAQKWMVNSERLWNVLQSELPRVPMIETYPTAISDGLIDSKVALALNTLQGGEKRKFYKDYIDASLCAIGAYAAYTGKSIQLGEDDELGSIHVLPKSFRPKQK
ncbi:MAG: hypothetical protein KC713_00200 [Candidatus Omnitrophica bacterium]|nr:hypothetical protein [Candidatus Omnitrophota bacterium]